MKIIRSTTCSLKFATAKKREVLSKVLTEYGKIVNSYIDLFWNLNLEKGDLLKPVIDKVNSPYSFRLKKVAAREAIDMIKSVRERWKDKPNKISKPKHSGNRMMCSSTLIELNKSKTSFDFY